MAFFKSPVLVCTVLAVLVLVLYAGTGLAVPVPEEMADQPENDASASSNGGNVLQCANEVGSGSGFNNCSMPSMPSGMPSPPGVGAMPSAPSRVPSAPEGLPTGMPNTPAPPSREQVMNCAASALNGTASNNCANIMNPGFLFGTRFGTRKEE